MKFARAAAAALGLVFAATAAMAADAPAPASVKGCIDMSKKVKEALDANQQSPNLNAARSSINLGRDYCTWQMYGKGVNSYARALQLLGVG